MAWYKWLYNGLVQIMFHVLHPCVAPAIELLPDVSELWNHLNWRGLWEVSSSVSCSKQAEDLVSISWKDVRAQHWLMLPSESCWAPVLIVNENICQNRPDCLKTGVKDLGFELLSCSLQGLGVYQPCFHQNKITLISKFGSCPGQ